MTANRTQQIYDALHPWYGPCDGLLPNNKCSECENVKTGDIVYNPFFWKWCNENLKKRNLKEFRFIDANGETYEQWYKREIVDGQR